MNTATRWLGASLLFAVLLAGAAGDAFALGRCRDCAPPCPPPPPVQIILNVCHPCTGCTYDIPVCIPACVQGAPCAHFQRTILGDGKTVFEWPSGYSVTIRYHRGGGYRVVQHG